MKKNNIWLICGLAAVSLAVYSNSLKNGFTYDDLKSIINNENIRNWRMLFSNMPGFRPISIITFGIDYSIWKLNPFGYHLTNVLLFIVCVLLCYKTSMLVTSRSSVAFLAALLFILQPVHTEVVNNASNRADLLATVFLLSSFILYIKGNRSNAGLLLSLVFFAISLMTKEAVGIVLPFLIIGYDFYFTLQGSIKHHIRKMIKFYALYLLVIAIFLFGMEISSTYRLPRYIGEVTNKMNIETIATGKHQFGKSSIPFITMTRYMSLYTVPINLSAIYPYPDITSIETYKVIRSIIVCAIFIGLLIIGFRYFKDISFGLYWFLIGLLPFLHIFHIVPHYMADRYLFAPSYGTCLVSALLIDRIYVQAIKSKNSIIVKNVFYSLLLALFVFYSILIIQRNKDWKSNYTLWSKTVFLYPESVDAHVNLGYACESQGLFDKALDEYKAALTICDAVSERIALEFDRSDNMDINENNQIKPRYLSDKYALLHYNLGSLYGRKKYYELAQTELCKAIEYDTSYFMAYYNLGVVRLCMGSVEEGIGDIKKAVQINPRLDIAHYTLALQYQEMKLYREAMREYYEAVRIDPKYKEYEYRVRFRK
ncbi:MAG: glycosyltransferase family 39 protein [Candidatus Krumholzibacteriota bacterium]|nr:glycosyltransferase family 39 protein [Candidatus Krumholzibacteriota bacterium]